jgi:hypothetical protein
LVLTQPCCLSAPSTWCCCCRCPCLGACIVQAHVCGRLPRDTLVAAHVPKVPSAVVSTDTPYFFRWGRGAHGRCYGSCMCWC